MKLREFLLDCKKLIDENPNALDMEMITCHGASGCVDPIGSPSVDKISDWDDTEMPVAEIISTELDSVVCVYVGN